VAKGDAIDNLIEKMNRPVRSLLERLEGDEFTTGQFIELMLTDETGAAAYRQALADWGESESRAKMVIHGQVIPAALRNSGMVEWAGFAYGEDDPYAVPARWRVKPGASS
jgi:hypothetical protein